MRIEIIHGIDDDYLTLFEITLYQKDIEENSLILFCITIFNYDLGILIHFDE